MEILFSTELQNNGQPTEYGVSFSEEAYHFTPTDGSTPFTLKREHDEWHTKESIDEQTYRAAIAALEDYLLSQH